MGKPRHRGITWLPSMIFRRSLGWGAELEGGLSRWAPFSYLQAPMALALEEQGTSCCLCRYGKPCPSHRSSLPKPGTASHQVLLRGGKQKQATAEAGRKDGETQVDLQPPPPPSGYLRRENWAVSGIHSGSREVSSVSRGRLQQQRVQTLGKHPAALHESAR